MITMNEREREELLKSVDLASLKAAAKSLGIKPGRCPTKMTIAKLLPEETLKALARK